MTNKARRLLIERTRFRQEDLGDGTCRVTIIMPSGGLPPHPGYQANEARKRLIRFTLAMASSHLKASGAGNMDTTLQKVAAVLEEASDAEWEELQHGRGD